MFLTIDLSNQLNIVDNNNQHELIEHNKNNNISTSEKKQCQHYLTFEQMKHILEQHACVSIEIEKNNIKRREKRWFNEKVHNKINAIHGTINEHHEMINFLFNNSINATILTNTIKDHHSYSLPQLTSWRDIVDIILISVLILYIIYFLIFRAGFKPCDRCLLRLSKNFTRHVEQHEENKETEEFDKQIQELKQQIQQLQNNEPIPIHTMYRNERNYPSIPSITNDIVRYNNGYLSE